MLYDDFYTTLAGYQSLKVKRILKDDKMYHLLFNHRDSNPGPEWDSNLDDFLYLYIEKKCHEYIIKILKEGIFRQSVYNALKFHFGMTTSYNINNKWHKRSKKEKHILTIELMNRFYGDDYGFKQHLKPLFHRKRIIYKPVKRKKNRRDRRDPRAIKNTLLINPYFPHPLSD